MKTSVAALLLALLAAGAQAQQDPAAEETPPADAQATGDQPAPAPAPADNAEALGLSMGEQETPQVGQAYTRETHGDWDVLCVRSESGNDPCQIHQLLEDQDGNSVAEISIFPLPDGGQAVAGATIVTPLETLLTAQVGLRVDSGEFKRYPFSLCTQRGCISRVGLTAGDIVNMRRGATATVQIRPALAPDQTVDLAVSLTGFTAGYEAAAAADEAARAQQ